MITSRDHYPPLLEEVAAQVRVKIESLGFPRAAAEDTAEHVAEHLRKFLGGAWYYVPLGHRYELAQRDREIYEKFNGRNQRELAKEYGITTVRLYQIVQEMRAERRRKL